jgi:hypothetical protein
MGTVLMLGLFLVPVARAGTPTNVQIEVNFLLGYIEGSGCVFFRNGTWHDSKAAQVHLRDKYNYLRTAHQIDTTEDFIEKVATKSSFSGQPYQVRCNDDPTMTSSQWLREELARLRTLK